MNFCVWRNDQYVFEIFQKYQACLNMTQKMLSFASYMVYYMYLFLYVL